LVRSFHGKPGNDPHQQYTGQPCCAFAHNPHRLLNQPHYEYPDADLGCGALHGQFVALFGRWTHLHWLVLPLLGHNPFHKQLDQVFGRKSLQRKHFPFFGNAQFGFVFILEPIER
jgi:hypothetical protein